MRLSKFKCHKFLICCCLIYFLFIINIFLNIRSFYLWDDESFTFHIIHHNFINIIGLTSRDVHPFLYYFIAKISFLFSKNTFIQIVLLRIISSIPYLILLIIGNTTIKHKFSNRVAIYFMFSLITMPLLVQNIYQIRMYGWAMLFTTIVFILFIYVYLGYLCNSVKIFIIISLFSLLASYTHYYALMSIFIIYLSFLILFLIKHKRLKYLILSTCLNILLYLPWLNIILRQTKDVSHKYWTQPINIKSIIKVILSPFTINPDYQNNKLIFVLSFIILLLILAFIIKNVHLNIYYIGIFIPLILICLGIILSIKFNHLVLMPRYITPSMGAFWLSLSILFNCNKKYEHSERILVTLLLFGMISYTDNYYHISTYDSDFRTTLNTCKSIPNNSKIIYGNSATMYGMSSYLKHNIVLGHLHDDLSFRVYKHVFNNINRKDNVNMSNKYRPIFYIDNIKKSINSANESKLSKIFFKKYRCNLKKYGQINQPLDGGKSYVYRLK